MVFHEPALRVPSSLGQERIWLLTRLHGSVAALHERGGAWLEGEVDAQGFEMAAREMARRHEVLRTIIQEHDGHPIQIIAPEPTLDWREVDLSGEAAPQAERRALELAREETGRPFDLERGPLWRLCVIRIHARRQLLVLTMHHLISDGDRSVRLFFEEMLDILRARAARRSRGLPPCSFQYADHARWERKHVAGALVEAQLAFWRSELAGAPVFLDLPIDKLRPAVQTFAGASVERTFPPALLADLRALGDREGVDLFSLLAAGLFVLLHRHSGQDEVLLGTPLPGRDHPEVQGLLGYFGNPVVLRGRLADDPPFRELLRQARQTVEAARTNGMVSFKDVVEALSPPRDLSRSPLFQVLFFLREPPREPPPDDTIMLTHADVELPFVAYDLIISAQEAGGGLRLRIEYNRDLFEEATVADLLLRLEILLGAAVAAPDARISALPLLLDDERHRILVEWNDTRTNYPKDACIHELFEAQAQRDPDAVAVTFHGDVITYGELDRRANQVAHRLIEEGVGPDTRVGIVAERSAEVIVGLLGILKAGGVYVPLDPDHPKERLQFMLEDVGAPILLGTSRSADHLAFQGKTIDLLSMGRSGRRDAPIVRGLTASSLAYVIFTSGSTGRPKGVAVPHRAVVRLVVESDYVNITPRERVMQASNLSFDASTFEIWGALLNGARLSVIPKDTLLAYSSLSARIREEGIDVMFLSTAIFHQIAGAAPEMFRGLEYVVVGGDALQPSACREVLAKGPPKRLVNGYGPTENTTFSTAYRVTDLPAGATRVPIGAPIANSTAYILDRHMQPVPVGFPGELYVGGDGLAHGYVNRPELTAERFVENPFGEGRLYRTGDKARHRPDGTIDFLGRVDRQVKIRGFRVEVGEVETNLREHPAVKDVAVVVHVDASGDKQLVAYVAARDARTASNAELRDFLRQRLPEFMLPGAFVAIAEIPLTPNGKVDHRALPAPGDTRPALDQAFVAPRSRIEAELAAIWQDVLHLDRVGIHDDFFALGGHSLRASRVAARIGQKLGVDVSLRRFFGAPTIAALAAVVEGALSERAPASPLTALPRSGIVPLSFAQERLWFLHQLAPESRAYQYPALFRLHGRLDIAALERALQEIVRRHESLRTTFSELEGRPMQVIAAGRELGLEIVDLRAIPAGEREAQARLRLRAEARRLFDLRRGPLVRAILIGLAEDDHALGIVLHHIVTDGWSMDVLYRELASLYDAFSKGEPSSLPALPIQYADYALWQQSGSEAPEQRSGLAWWRERLAGAPTVLDLPADHARPSVQTFRGDEVPIRIDATCGAALRTLAAREGTTPTTLLLAAFFALLHRYTGQEDILVGLPHANRKRAETEGLIGFFVNTVVLRGNLAGEPTFRELVARVHEASIEAQDHADVPFEQIVAALDPGRDLGRNPLVQVMFAPQPSARGGLDLQGIEVERLDPRLEKATCDLTWFLWEDEGNGFVGTLEYSADLFDRSTIERLAGHLGVLLTAAVEAPDTAVWKLPLLSAKERHRTLVEWNDTTTSYPRDASIHALFEEAVDRAPDAIAATFAGEAITYAELDRRANRVARRLMAEGVGPETPVGILVERSLDMLVGLLGILKAGGAYVPLDPEQPAERLSFILADAGVSVVLARTGATKELVFPGRKLEIASLFRSGEAHLDERPACPGVTPESLAYILFTSGSTGRPKGVAVSHRAIVRLVRTTDYVEFTPASRVMQGTNLSFDVSTFEIWGALLNGARLCMISKDTLLAPDLLSATIRAEGITIASMTPAVFSQMASLAPDAFRDVELLAIAGDVIHPGACRAVLTNGAPKRLLNAYGPTENTTYSTTHCVTEVPPGATSIPIGRPIANSTAYILDEHLQPVPIGVPGEIYVGGEGLARGYVNRPELTSARFIESPLPEAPGRLYRTGDLGRYLPDGAIDFLGRIDHQVKIRGFRVELGEIEAVLQEHPEVRDAVVITREQTPGNKRLVAYVSAKREPGPSSDELRCALRTRLPEYMIPSAFVFMSALPVTPNGKVDRRALPPPGEPETGLARDTSVPGTTLEQTLVEIWREVLGIAQIGVDDPFFDVGGHSLLLAQVRARIRERLGQDIDMVTLFQRSTVRKLSEHLAGAVKAAVPALQPAPAAPASPAAESDISGCIAIVGMAGRFPGAEDVEAFWRLLVEGREGISRFTEEELVSAGLDPDRIRAPSFVPAAGFLEGALDFDASFFGIGAKDAALMDPQQRLFLECAWQALESAGYDPARYPGAVGVFGGSGAPRYWIERVAPLGIPRGTAEEYRALTGNGQDFLATRIAYKLGLRGPALSVQTACSTSLVAVHVACQSLLSGQCDMALAGGASVFSFDRSGYVHEEGGILSPDGHCRPFDSEARGTVPASGVGVVVLKRLEDALAHGDTIRAILRGSAINNDGSAKIGYTAPSVEGQEEVITKAQAAARVAPGTLGYVEAHGTATPLGDPIEVTALTRAFQRGATRTAACVLGSVKGNVGHLDAAAGVTGLIKAALILERKLIPPTLHFRKPNPRLGLETSPFQVNSRLISWRADEGPRRAAVSAFGLGGTNAHVILEEAPPRPCASSPRDSQLLVLSARSTAALDAMGERLATHLRSGLPAPLADIAFTLQQGRRAFAHRLAVVCKTAEEAAEALKHGDRGRLCRGTSSGRAPKLVFMFPGGGTQQARMGMRLHAHERVYREALDRCAELFHRELGEDIRSLLMPPDDAWEETRARMQRPSLNMAAIFSTEVALAELLQSWGLRPSALLGHSLGEYAAAYVAGILRLEDAVTLVSLRGKLLDDLTGAAMLSVPLAEAALRERLGDGLAIAAVNGPESCVVAGECKAIDSLEASLRLEALEVRRIPVATASHSPLVAEAARLLSERAATMRFQAPRIPVMSNVTGDWMRDADARDPEYWARHLTQTVRFAESLAKLLPDPEYALVEVGPGKTLATLARTNVPPGATRLIVNTLSYAGSSRDDRESLLHAIGQLWCAGVEIDGSALSQDEQRRRVPLPTYPFERTTHVIEAPLDRRRREPVASPHAFDGTPSRAPAHAEPMESIMAGIWRELLGIPDARARDNFFDLGGSSLIAVQMRAAIRARLGADVPVHALLTHPTFGELLDEVRKSRALPLLPDDVARAPTSSSMAAPLLLRIQEGSASSTPLVLVQPIGGTVYTYRDLSRDLGGDLPVFAFRASGLEPGEPVDADVPTMAARYLRALLEVQPEGPYVLGGHSSGAVIAYEMANQLLTMGREVSMLVMIDATTVDQSKQLGITSVEEVRRLFAQFAHIAPRTWHAFSTALDESPALREVVVRTNQALKLYSPPRARVPVLYFRARERDDLLDAHPESWWMNLADGPFHVHNVPGNHFTVMERPHVTSVARILRGYLDALDDARPSRKSAEPSRVAPMTNTGISVLAPSGFRVDGLTVEEAAKLLRLVETGKHANGRDKPSRAVLQAGNDA